MVHDTVERELGGTEESACTNKNPELNKVLGRKLAVAGREGQRF